MLLLGEKPVISKIVESYPTDTEFLIGLGHKGDQIKEFLKLAYPQKKISFVNIKNYKGPGSSLTHTLKILSKKIKKEFIFHANDTVINFNGKINTNYDNLLVSDKKIKIKNLYRSVHITPNSFVKRLFEKKLGFEHAYVGVCFIKDYKRFNKIISSSKTKIGEFEYFKEIFADKKIFIKKVKIWHDIGNEKDYIKACEFYEKKTYLKKYDESIFFHDNKVFKFFSDKTKVSDRYERSKYLETIVPKILVKKKYFYVYKFIKGKILSEKLIDNKEIFELLNWCKKNLFKKIKLSKNERSLFYNDCKQFYYNKTMRRIRDFRKKTSILDGLLFINNKKTFKVSQLIKKINWREVLKGHPSKFHGDFHFENIIKIAKGYKLIDWREKFSNSRLYGDLYYDLAKLNHSFIVNHKKVDQKKFSLFARGNKIVVNIERRADLVRSQKLFYKFLRENNYSIYVVNILTSLIFLNIATLHHSPYREFLYYLGLDCLNKSIKNHQIIL
jgi:hypothetical protein